MTLLDQIIYSLRWRMLRSEIGVFAWQGLRRILRHIAPYTPPRITIPAERLAPFVLLEVRPSSIPNTGSGVFALQDIEPGITIGEYSGDTVDSVFNWLRLRETDYLALTDDPAISIDALAHPEMLLRYVNHHPDNSRVNVHLRTKDRRVYFETSRPVTSGEEFFTDYGDLYWRIRRIIPRAG